MAGIYDVLGDPMNFALYGLDRNQPDWVSTPFPFVLNLGAGNKTLDGTTTLDWPDWDAETERIPYVDNCVDAVLCTHFLEHLSREGIYHVLSEVGRVLRPGCAFTILVPHAQSLMYLQDLDHKTPFVMESWKTLLSNPYYGKDKNKWPFRIGANFLFGLSERNLALVTQLIKEG